MKLATFVCGGLERLGALTERGLLDLAAAAQICGQQEAAQRVLGDAMALLGSGGAGLDLARGLLARAETLPEVVLCDPGQVTFLPPVPRPAKLLLMGGNWSEHIQDKTVQSPPVFMKPPATTLIGHGQPIMIQKTSKCVDPEVELAVIMGRRGRYIPAERAREYVAGYTILNDVSERAFNPRPGQERTGRDEFFDWLHGKWFDGFAPCGPYLVCTQEIADPQALDIRLRVNGETQQDSHTSHMAYTVPEIIEFISQIVTLEPGDIIATGCPGSPPGGVGKARGQYLRPGDVVEAEIEKIGMLRSPVIAEPAR